MFSCCNFNHLSNCIQDWLQKYGPFDAVVDGANLGHMKSNYFDFNQVQIRQMAYNKPVLSCLNYYKHQFEHAYISLITINLLQLKNAVNLTRNLSPSKRLPLVILHSGRVKGQHNGNLKNKMTLQHWKESHALYVTPQGSNDDW